MRSIAWWPVLVLIAVATVTDVRSRRIPNWLVVPFLLAGIITSTVTLGLVGLGRSAAGLGLAVLLTGVLCWLRGLGMGDLKLCAAVGVWVGPAQMGTALVATGLAGGVMALIWATCHGSLKKSIDGTGDLLSGFWKKGIQPHPTLALGKPGARAMPYAPAIALGTLFSFFCT